MNEVAALRERLVNRAVIGRRRAKRLDPSVDASAAAAEEFIDLLYDYFVARLRSEALVNDS
jgi:hypothetical protein